MNHPACMPQHPIVRPGQRYESIPSLAIIIHSGESKAQQYLNRGYNLDHGTDFANSIDDMPVNRPTNAILSAGVLVGVADLAASGHPFVARRHP